MGDVPQNRAYCLAGMTSSRSDELLRLFRNLESTRQHYAGCHRIRNAHAFNFRASFTRVVLEGLKAAYSADPRLRFVGVRADWESLVPQENICRFPSA